jgi:hypothetical protein
MKDWNAIQKRYLRDTLPTRLGGIAANLSRVKSFAARVANQEAVASLLEESKFFIEWTAGEADIDTAAELVELQVESTHPKQFVTHYVTLGNYTCEEPY